MGFRGCHTKNVNIPVVAQIRHIWWFRLYADVGGRHLVSREERSQELFFPPFCEVCLTMRMHFPTNGVFRKTLMASLALSLVYCYSVVGLAHPRSQDRPGRLVLCFLDPCPSPRGTRAMEPCVFRQEKLCVVRAILTLVSNPLRHCPLVRHHFSRAFPEVCGDCLPNPFPSLA